MRATGTACSVGSVAPVEVPAKRFQQTTVGAKEVPQRLPGVYWLFGASVVNSLNTGYRG